MWTSFFLFYLDDNGDDWYDDGWIDELAMLVDSHCDSQRFGNDERESPSICSFLVDGKNRIQCPIAKQPHCGISIKIGWQIYKFCFCAQISSNSNSTNIQDSNIQSISGSSEAIALCSFIDPKMHPYFRAAVIFVTGNSNRCPDAYWGSFSMDIVL